MEVFVSDAGKVTAPPIATETVATKADIFPCSAAQSRAGADSRRAGGLAEEIVAVLGTPNGTVQRISAAGREAESGNCNCAGEAGSDQSECECSPASRRGRLAVASVLRYELTAAGTAGDRAARRQSSSETARARCGGRGNIGAARRSSSDGPGHRSSKNSRHEHDDQPARLDATARSARERASAPTTNSTNTYSTNNYPANPTGMPRVPTMPTRLMDGIASALWRPLSMTNDGPTAPMPDEIANAPRRGDRQAAGVGARAELVAAVVCDESACAVRRRRAARPKCEADGRRAAES